MLTSSPLRYPGGKSSLVGVLRQIRKMNGLAQHAIAEPFAGGAGASLTLLFGEEVPVAHINDADPAIFDFWWAATNRPQHFARMLAKTRVTMAEWRRQRAAYRGSRTGRLQRGFAAFYLNRCNRSGIIVNGGPIGGIKQDGEWKLDARFNKEELGRRLERLAEFGPRVQPTGLDGIDFIKSLDASKTFFFIDPPYFEKGKTLYLNALDETYHCRLGEQLQAMESSAWVLTYDDCPEIRRIYEKWANIKPFALGYAASNRRKGKEILITPRWMTLPSEQTSDAITW